MSVKKHKQVLISPETHAEIKVAAADKGLTITEYIKMCHEFYHLKHIELLARQIKNRHRECSFTAPDKAALEIIGIYLNSILD